MPAQSISFISLGRNPSESAIEYFPDESYLCSRTGPEYRLCLENPVVISQLSKCYTVPKTLTAIQWITDFSDQVKQVEAISKMVADQGNKCSKVSRLFLASLDSHSRHV